MAIKIRKRQQEGDADNLDESGVPKTIDMDIVQGKGGVGVAPAGSDPILDATMQGMSWVDRNRNLILAGLIVAVVGSLGVWAYSAYSSSQQVAASQMLSPAIWDYEVFTKDSETFKQIEQSDVIPMPEKVFATDAERWQAIYDGAAKALAENGSGAIAQSARLTQAAAAMHLEKADEAVTLYNAYLEGKTLASAVPFAYLGLANAYAATGDIDKAIQNFDKLGELGESYAGMATYQKAQLLDVSGKTKEAKELYHEILEGNPETPNRDAIERRLAFL